MSDRVRLAQAHLEDDVPLVRLAARCSVAERTLRRWLAGYQVGSLTAWPGQAGPFCTAVAPDAVFTVRTYGDTRPLYDPHLGAQIHSTNHETAGQQDESP
jgi:transposase-like protein